MKMSSYDCPLKIYFSKIYPKNKEIEFLNLYSKILRQNKP